MTIQYDASKQSITLDGKPLSLRESLRWREHSPSGFSFGYCGSGPAQSAVAILLAVSDPFIALRYYQRFKFDVISRLPQTSFTREVDVKGWLDEQIANDHETRWTQEEKERLLACRQTRTCVYAPDSGRCQHAECYHIWVCTPETTLKEERDFLFPKINKVDHEQFAHITKT